MTNEQKATDRRTPAYPPGAPAIGDAATVADEWIFRMESTETRVSSAFALGNFRVVPGSGASGEGF